MSNFYQKRIRYKETRVKYVFQLMSSVLIGQWINFKDRLGVTRYTVRKTMISLVDELQELHPGGAMI